MFKKNLKKNIANHCWVTVFPNLEWTHVYKDVGMIPMMMAKCKDYTSFIATYEDGVDILQSNQYVKGKLIQRKYKNDKLNVSDFIWNNAKKIDVLNIYHMSLSEAVLWVLPYKLRNQGGKVYLKLDVSTKYLGDYIDNKLMLLMRKLFLPLYDLVSGETTVVCSEMNKYYNNRIIHISNGYYWRQECEDVSQRENVVLHVSRMGTEEKNTYVLVRAFASTVGKHNWKLRLIGSMEPEFQRWYREYIIEHNLEGRIEYIGSVYDRDEMKKEYERSKIFILPSNWESFSLALVEALSCGNYLIVTPGVNSGKDIIIDERIGDICDNSENEISGGIVKGITLCDEDEEGFYYRMNFAKQNYAWEYLCNKIQNGLDHIKSPQKL